MNKTMNKRMDTRSLVKIAVLGVIAFLIMLIEVPLWFTPEFLKIDLSDIPAVVGGFALGPVAGIAVELVKNILKLATRGTNTAGVGELANFLVGSIFVVTAAYFYRKNRSKKDIVVGLCLATLFMAVSASLLNYFFLLPFYAKAYGIPLTAYVDMAKSVNSLVVDLRTFIVFGILPFNLLKGVLMSLMAYPVYTRARATLER